MATTSNQREMISSMQINEERAAKTGAEMRDIAEKRNVQVVAIQEPYTIKGKVCSFGGRARVVSGEKKGETAWPAIVVFDPSIVVMRIDQFSDSHIACSQLQKGDIKVYVISEYFQYSHAIEGYLARVSRIVRQLRGHKVVICLDANAKFPIWYSKERTDEGEALENLIM